MCEFYIILLKNDFNSKWSSIRTCYQLWCTGWYSGSWVSVGVQQQISAPGAPQGVNPSMGTSVLCCFVCNGDDHMKLESIISLRTHAASIIFSSEINARLKTDFPLYLSGRQLSSSCCLQVFRWFLTGGAVTVSNLTTHARRRPALPRQRGSDEPRHGASGCLVCFSVRMITRVCGTRINIKAELRFLHCALSGQKRAEKVPFESLKCAIVAEKRKKISHESNQR